MRTLQTELQRRPMRRAWWISGAVPVLVMVLLSSQGLAQTPPQLVQPPPGALSCDPLLDKPLRRIPELISDKGILRGTILLKDEQVLLPFRYPPGNVPGTPGVLTICFPQYVRELRGVDAQPAISPSVTGQLPLPIPGPTLRARVGDMIELAFLNQINPANFGDSIDRAEKGLGNGCDETTAGYPGEDLFPDCFHGSSTGNLHFHGTHTNPTATGDNVFVEVRPSPKSQDGAFLYTTQNVQAKFDRFFEACERELKDDPLKEWPTSWNNRPLGPPDREGTWLAEQKALLQEYDRDLPPPQRLWPVDEFQYRQDVWPQYYIGAFPYCFRVPEYKEAGRPPATSQPARAAMQMGPLKPPGEPLQGVPLMAGQAPGTHWYHAHKHGSTTINVSNGMTGAFIIEGGYDDDLNAFYGEGWTRTQPVLVINQLGVTPNLERRGPGQSDKGADFSVNGQTRPVLTMRSGEVQLWRILNTSSRSGAYFASLPAGFSWKQTAQDGVQFAEPNYQSNNNRSFLMAAGNRVDLLVKAPTAPGTYPVLVQSEVDPSDLASTRTPAYKVTLFSVNVTSTPATGNQSQLIPSLYAGDKVPPFPTFLKDIDDDEVSGTKTIVFQSSNGPPFSMHTIDGKKFDGEVGAVVLLNKVEEWKIVNKTFGPPISHPFHIHINPFQVVEVFDPNQKVDANGKPLLDPSTPGAVPKYVLTGSPQLPPPPQQLKPGQCLLDVSDPSTWHPCDEKETGNRIWWDVFPISSGLAPKGSDGKTPITGPDGKTPVQIPGYFKMRSRFVDYPGQYVMHCHILAHEDRGMMTVVEVVPRQTAMSHQ